MREMKTAMSEADILVVGGGIVGMSVAMELRARGASVLVVERAGLDERVEGMASWAAGGMIAAEDPYHPAELREFSLWSAGLYDRYLEGIGGGVPYQTYETRQYLEDGSVLDLVERSVNPRELFLALRGVVGVKAGVEIVEAKEDSGGVVATSASGETFHAGKVVWANGAWLKPWMEPRKGQMMRIRLEGEVVHRAEHVYVVPRTMGEQAGTTLVGATVEDVGFDLSVSAADLERVREVAATMVPEVRGAEIVESWVGFRPTSRNGLPVMSVLPGSERQFVCGGHFRNGILLAPGSAKVMSDLVAGQQPAIDVSAFGVGEACDK